RHAWRDQRGAFRQDLQHQRARPAVHRAEGAAAADQGFLSDPHRLDGVDQRLAACAVYNASKAAVRSFARTWIVDLKGRDIRVNLLSPGYTATPSMSDFMTAEEQAAAVATVPLGRIGTPDDLGKAAVFLASDDSAYVTGIELFVDGGAAQI